MIQLINREKKIIKFYTHTHIRNSSSNIIENKWYLNHIFIFRFTKATKTNILMATNVYLQYPYL